MPAFSAGVFGKTRATVTNVLCSVISMPTPPYRPLVWREKSAICLGVKSSEYGSLSSFTRPRAAFSKRAGASTVSTKRWDTSPITCSSSCAPSRCARD